MDAGELLLAAVRAAPRRYRMPALPADAAAAAAAGPETALAFAIEALRRGEAGAATAALFTGALADWIRQALSPEAGDPAFQALVLRTQQAQVQEYVRLAAQAPADRRAIRCAVDAIAHPGKTRSLPPGALRDGLQRLHRLAGDGAWRELPAAAQALPADASPARDTLLAVLASPTRDRLERLDALLQAQPVRQYLALCGRQGPPAGSAAATARGRASAREGNRAESEAVAAFGAIADRLNRDEPAARLQVVRSLRPPRGFPGDAGKAKDEWDVALVRHLPGHDGADIVLLAEVKAAPAAATPDFPRLLRGLERLAQTPAGGSHAFGTADAPVRVSGESLRALQPQGRALPPHVIYCCCAPPERQPQLLAAAAKAVLLAEPASIAFARQLDAGQAPPATQLLPVWQALATAPRLRSALHQYDTACAVRAAMLHPDDLQATMAAIACTPATSSSSSSSPPSGAPPSP